jgi:RloB-like protein
MARQSKKIKPKPVLLIACEGTSTERDYFTSWSQTLEAKDNFSAINVYPVNKKANNKTNPHQLVDLAIENLENGTATVAWAVFDRDGHPLMPETFNKARKNNVNIGFSARSFETWVLLHFEKSSFAFLATQCKNLAGKDIQCGIQPQIGCTGPACLCGHIRRKSFIPNYSKKNDYDLFTDIYPSIEIAMVNASWQRWKCKPKNAIPIYDINPYSDVDNLIKFIQGDNTQIMWGSIIELVETNHWSLQVISNIGNLVVELTNTGPNSHPVNQNFIENHFGLTDDSITILPCDFINYRKTNGEANQILLAGESVEYTLAISELPYLRFRDNAIQSTIFIELF